MKLIYIDILSIFLRFETLNQSKFYVSFYIFYIRGKGRRGDGGHVLRAQVLRGVGSDKGLCPSYMHLRVGWFCTGNLDRIRI